MAGKIDLVINNPVYSEKKCHLFDYSFLEKSICA